MTFEEAIHWCREHDIEISFCLSPDSSKSTNSFETVEVTSGSNFLKMIKEMKRKHRQATIPDDEALYNTPIDELSFQGRHCKGRILRLARVLEVETIGQLLDWAAEHPRGLQRITDYNNISDGTLGVLTQALKDEGVESILE